MSCFPFLFGPAAQYEMNYYPLATITVEWQFPSLVVMCNALIVLTFFNLVVKSMRFLPLYKLFYTIFKLSFMVFVYPIFILSSPCCHVQCPDVFLLNMVVKSMRFLPLQTILYKYVNFQTPFLGPCVSNFVHWILWKREDLIYNCQVLL